MPLSETIQQELQARLNGFLAINKNNQEAGEICQFLEDLNLLRAEDSAFIVLLLQKSNSDGWHIGHIIAHYQKDPKV